MVGRIQEGASRILAGELGLEAKATMGFAMALSEACQNIVEHAGTGGWVAVQAYNYRRRLGRRVAVIAVSDSGIGFRRSLEPTQAKRYGDRWRDGTALEAALIQGVSRFRDPGRGQGLAGIKRYLQRWEGKISVRSGTARIAIVPAWDDDVPLVEDLLFPSPVAGDHSRPGRRHHVIETIAVARMLREAVTTPYLNLVTRPTGVAVRGRIESVLATSEWETAMLDFSDVVLLDPSCADEVVAKLVRMAKERLGRIGAARSRRAPLGIDPRRAEHQQLAVAVLSGRDDHAAGSAPADVHHLFERLEASTALSIAALSQRLDWADERTAEALAAALSLGVCRCASGGTCGRRSHDPPPGLPPPRFGVLHRRPDWSPVVPPLLQTSTFTNPVGSADEVLYTRYGNNPNQVDIAKKYALLEGAEAALFLSSGMAATALAHLAMLRPGDHLVSSSWIYGGTKNCSTRSSGGSGSR